MTPFWIPYRQGFGLAALEANMDPDCSLGWNFDESNIPDDNRRLTVGFSIGFGVDVEDIAAIRRQRGLPAGIVAAIAEVSSRAVYI